MDDVSAGLQSVLAAIRPHLPDIEAADIANFIEAGEYGIATDTLFCAIRDDGIAIDSATAKRLSAMTDLFNTFGDLDPAIPDLVLRPN